MISIWQVGPSASLLTTITWIVLAKEKFTEQILKVADITNFSRYSYKFLKKILILPSTLQYILS